MNRRIGGADRDDPMAGTDHIDRLNASLARRYRIEEELAAGGMATIYRADDLRHRRQVAIKLLRPELAAALGADRFLREIEIAAGLSHPHILPLYDSGEVDGLLYYVMPYVDGESLRDRLGREGAFPMADAARILRDMADALAYAHQRGIVHRDIKPDNVMLSGRHALVTDFGIAKAVSQATTDKRPATGAVVFGTPGYMAPEQVTAAPDIDHRADIYALGAVGYELLTGLPPFVGETAQEVLSAHLLRTPEPPDARRPDVAPGLARLVMKCLEKKPDDRWQTATELLFELDALSPAGSVTPARPSLPTARLTGRRALIGGAIALVVMLGMGGLALRRAGDGQPARQASGEARIRMAVLPFENLRGAPDEVFIDGITRDVNMQLSKIGQFSLTAHGSAQRASAAGGSHSDIARRLGVDYLIGGSVSRAGDGVRITASLIDPRSAASLWADDYDRDVSVSSLVDAGNQVALQVARALKVTPTPEDRRRFAARPTDDIQAYREYQLGRFFMSKRTPEGFEAAIAHFERAIARDPRYALAHAGLADVYVLMPYFSSRVPAAASFARSGAAAARALALDPSLAQAHTALGLAREFEFRWDAAEEHFRRAIELEPDYPTAHHWYADMLSRRRGRSAEALAAIRRALELDPLSTIINQDLGYVLSLAGEHEAAIQQYQSTLELDPGFSSTWLALACTLLEMGRYEAGGNALSRWARLTGHDPATIRQLADAAAAHAQTRTPQPVPPGIDIDRTFGPFAVPILYMALGQKEIALTVLERYYQDGVPSGVMTVVQPSFDELQSEPRFQALLRKAGLDR